MTTALSFSSFAAQLRGFIHEHSGDGLPGGPRGDDDSEFNRLALALFALQFAHNAPYRRFCQARQANPDTIRHWSEIPAIAAAGFKDLGLTSLAPDERTRTFHSSGTTGQTPSRHFHDAESLALYEASLLPWFQKHLRAVPSSMADEMDCISLAPTTDAVPNSSLVHMFETIHRQPGWRESAFTGRIGPEGVWLLDFDKTLGALEMAIAANRPALLMGTAFSFVHLLDHLAKINQRLRLPRGSRVLETGGYKGRSRAVPKAELHALITERLGVGTAAIICEYGMSELGSQAYDWVLGSPPNANRVFRFPPWARAQIVSPETGREVADGETGLIRIFDLANVRSVTAIQTEDLGIRRDDGFELLGRAALAEPRGCSLMAN